jgi:hypothetical protein
LPGFIETNYGNEISFSWPAYEIFRDKTDVFSGVIARFPFRAAIAGEVNLNRHARFRQDVPDRHDVSHTTVVRLNGKSVWFVWNSYY